MSSFRMKHNWLLPMAPCYTGSTAHELAIYKNIQVSKYLFTDAHGYAQPNLTAYQCATPTISCSFMW